MPRSNQPVSRSSTCSPLVRSTVGPQAAVASRTTERRMASARMRAILEHSNLDPLQRLLARNLAGEKIRQVRTLEPDDARARVAVRRREARPIVVPLG